MKYTNIRKIVLFSRAISIFWACLTCLYENLSKDITQIPRFLFLFTKNKQSLESYRDFSSFQFIVISDIIVILLVYVRIEFYKREDNSPNLGSYTLKTLRIVFGLIFIVSGLVLVRFFTNFRSYNIRLIPQFFLTNVIPSVMIFKNENMWNYTKKKFKLISNCFNNVVHISPP